MKNAILLHGSSCNPNSYWLPSIKLFLEKRGYSVWVPQLPEPEMPSLKLQSPLVLNSGKFSKDTIIIAHFAGCPLALSVLEKLDVTVNKAILVAGYAGPLSLKEKTSLEREEKDAMIILQGEYNWDKIKGNAKEITFINSDNDPWGCDDKEGRYMFNHLGGRLIILHGEGHMGSDTFNQPYKEFPLLEKLLEL